MERLSPAERDLIDDLFQNGTSINTASGITQRAKSTLYYHYKKRFGKKFAEVQFNYSQEELGEFIGIFAGDGNFLFDRKRYKYRIQFFTGLHDPCYNQYLAEFFVKILGKHPRQRISKTSNIFILEYYSRPIYELIRSHLEWEGVKAHSARLKPGRSPAFIRGFLRGLFDTDGNFYKPKTRVAYGTASLRLARQVERFLKEFGLRPSLYWNRRVYRIDLYSNDSLRFINTIEPRNSDKLKRP